MRAVDRKWDLRLATASSEAELERAVRDGGSRALTAVVFAPAEGLALTAFWYWVFGRRHPSIGRADP